MQNVRHGWLSFFIRSDNCVINLNLKDYSIKMSGLFKARAAFYVFDFSCAVSFVSVKNKYVRKSQTSLNITL